MSQTGSLIVRTFASRAQIPVPEATVVVSSPGADGKQEIRSVQLTNESGFTDPIQLPAPDSNLSDAPGNAVPFASYTLVVEHPGYQVALFEGLQVFAGVETVQNVPLFPLSMPESSGNDAASTVRVTPQPL